MHDSDGGRLTRAAARHNGSAPSGDGHPPFYRPSVATITLLLVLGAVGLLGTVGCGALGPQEVAVREVLERQQKHWNSGDLDAFLENSYWQSGALSFLTGDAWYHGYEALQRSFRRSYPEGVGMGVLQLRQVQTRVLGAEHVLACGRWRLTPQKGTAREGVFTLIFEYRFGNWRIVHEHSSRDIGDSPLDSSEEPLWIPDERGGEFPFPAHNR